MIASWMPHTWGLEVGDILLLSGFAAACSLVAIYLEWKNRED